MAIQVTIDHFNRLVIGVGQGTLTVQDLVGYGLEVLRANVVSYGKIIDVATATPGFTRQELMAFTQVLRETRADAPRGPVALVIDRRRGEMARLFAGVDIGGRPANVFRTIHEAREWITAQMHPRPSDDG